MSEADTWIAQDKGLHAAAGFLVGFASSLAVDHFAPDLSPWAKRIVAIVPVIAVGIGKELYDSADQEHHSAEWEDAAATIIGGTIAVGIVLRF